MRCASPHCFAKVSPRFFLPKAKTDAAELATLREKVRRLNNESMAQKVMTLSRASPPSSSGGAALRSSNRDAPAAANPLTVVRMEEVRKSARKRFLFSSLCIRMRKRMSLATSLLEEDFFATLVERVRP